MSKRNQTNTAKVEDTNVVSETNTESTIETTSTPAPVIAKTPQDYFAEYGSVSGAIRGLLALGHERKVVAKMLDKRYQHVRNVAITPVKKVTATPNQ